MKKLLVFLCAMFVGTICFAHTINWHVGDQIISTTTCDSGDTITPPTAPAKYGYTFVGWGSYLQLEYIESTGTQYIDTGQTFTKDYKFEFRTRLLRYDGIVFGANSNGYEVCFGYYYNDRNHLGGLFTYEWQTNKDYDVILDLANTSDNLKLIVNSSVIRNISGDTNNKKFYLFGGIYNGNSQKIDKYAVQRYYSFNTYNKIGLLQNLIPVRRIADNVVGMYDTVSGQFFTNAGTGEFIAGPVVGVLNVE